MSKIDLSIIKRDNILKAFEKYDDLHQKGETNKNRKAKDYILFYNSKEYPHKYIIGIAYGIATGENNVLDNNLYNSTGNHKSSAQWCIENHGFELYADKKYKEYLSSKYTNKTTVNTYYSDLKKAIKICQNIDTLRYKKLSEIFEYILLDNLTFEDYDKSQKALGYDDKQLFSTLKTKVKTYFEALDEEEISEQDLETLIQDFILQSKTSDQKYKKYKVNYKGCQTDASFGQGGLSHTPWIAFLNYDQEIQKGIYPVLLIDKTKQSLSITFGVSANNKPNRNWSNMEEYENVDIQKYKESFLYKKVNDIYNKEINYSNIVEAINFVINKFHEEFNGDTNMFTINDKPLNQILYGPPGTGKTYNTINKALEIIFEVEKKDTVFKINGNEYEISYEDAVDKNDRKALTGIFDYYKGQGQIDFITFHQSYGYEEFVEGIRAIPVGEEGNENGTEMVYKVVDGIFKSLVRECTSKDEIIETDLTNYEKANIWKMSLGNSQNGEDKEYYEEAVNTDTLIMGYGGNFDYTNCNEIQSIKELNDHETSAGMIHRFKNELKTNDIVIISDGNRKFKAIVQVVGGYFYDENSDLKHKRKIKWLKKFTTSRNYSEISDRYFTQVTLNRPKGVDKEALLRYLSEKKTIDNTEKNYILIIDEINRGNISKIFGELITLIEPSKRIGEDEEIKVKLPYSGDEFGVPSNLYIIGTMNTADRSIALMDTALRRRFEFEEMMPELDAVKDIKVGGIEIKLLLDTLNKRIEYLYDRDHTIGHAYFMSLIGKSQEGANRELDNIFRNKIIPLLQEYFYDDWEKIQMVLGDHPEQKADDENKFIKSIELKEETLFGFDHEDIDDVQVTYVINDTFTVEAFNKIRLNQEEQ